jgi:phasin family protein
MKKTMNDSLLASQKKAVESSRAIAEVAVKNAQEITALNQKAAQNLAQAFQEKVAELLKVKDPRAAFDLIQAQVLQDAALQVTNYQNEVAQVLKTGNRELTRIAEDMIAESKSDLIHFVNEATANAPAGADAYVSHYKISS